MDQSMKFNQFEQSNRVNFVNNSFFNVSLDCEQDVGENYINHLRKIFKEQRYFKCDQVNHVKEKLLPPTYTPRCCHRSVYIEPYIMLFAGEDLAQYFQDVHIYNIRTDEWQVPQFTKRPIARTQHAFVYRKSNHSLMALYGFSREESLSDVLECKIRDSSEQWVWEGITTEGANPPAICGHSVVYQEKSDSLVFFGGGKHGVYNNTVYILDIQSRTWRSCSSMRKLHSKGQLSKHDSQGTIDTDIDSLANILSETQYNNNNFNSSFPTRNQINSHHFSHIHEVTDLEHLSQELPLRMEVEGLHIPSNFAQSDPDSQLQFETPYYTQTSQPHALSTETTPQPHADKPNILPVMSTLNKHSLDQTHIPQARARHTAVIYKDNEMIIFGGFNGSKNCADTWKFFIDDERWEYMTCTGDIPTPRSNHDVSLINDYMYIYGGDTEEPTHILYYLDLRTCIWTKIHHLESIPRWGHTIDVNHNGRTLEMYIIAGCTNQGNSVQLLPSMNMLELNVPKRMFLENCMKENMKASKSFVDCIVTTQDDIVLINTNHSKKRKRESLWNESPIRKYSRHFK